MYLVSTAIPAIPGELNSLNIKEYKPKTIIAIMDRMCLRYYLSTLVRIFPRGLHDVDFTVDFLDWMKRGFEIENDRRQIWSVIVFEARSLSAKSTPLRIFLFRCFVASSLLHRYTSVVLFFFFFFTKPKKENHRYYTRPIEYRG